MFINIHFSIARSEITGTFIVQHNVALAVTWLIILIINNSCIVDGKFTQVPKCHTRH